MRSSGAPPTTPFVRVTWQMSEEKKVDVLHLQSFSKECTKPHREGVSLAEPGSTQTPARQLRQTDGARTGGLGGDCVGNGKQAARQRFST